MKIRDKIGIYTLLRRYAFHKRCLLLSKPERRRYKQ